MLNIDELFTDEIKEYITKIKPLLSTYEYINLIDLSLAKIIMTREHLTIENINVFTNIINEARKRKNVNDNHEVYKQSIQYIINNYFEKRELNRQNFNLLVDNWFNNGYLFHSFNSCFLSQINCCGVNTFQKPWDTSELIKIVKTLNFNPFGLFNGKNGIFFTTSLKSAPYYGLSSPTFFRKFIENSPKYLNVFLNRDLIKANESVHNLCIEHNLSQEDANYVLDFFKKQWLLYCENSLPSILLKKRTNKVQIDYPSQDQINYLINLIVKDERNFYIKENIAREELIIFSYEQMGTIKNNSLAKKNN